MRVRDIRLYVCVAVVSAAIPLGLAWGQGVVADPDVPQVSYEVLAQPEPSDLYALLDSIEYWALPLAPPPDYYALVSLENAAVLRGELHSLISGHHVYPYSTSSVPGSSNHSIDVWDIVAIADMHPEHPDRVLDVYLNGTFDRQSKGTNANPRYDREHSWPKSLGFPTQSTGNPAYSDAHHLFAAYNTYNSSRSNLPYGSLDESGALKPTLENIGRGGGLTETDGSNVNFGDRFEVWAGRRGDVARAMFYMAVRYDGDAPGEADLRLTDDVGLIVKRSDAWEDSDPAFMGVLADLLEWHREDPVDDLERRRNTVVFLFQGNRNPFVDHPSWAEVIFAGAPLDSIDADEGEVLLGGGEAWINEFHYDNAGADQGEFIEIAGRSGVLLDGWSLVGYSGNGGRVYKKIDLFGVIPDEGSGVGAVAFDFVALQNGARDQVSSPDGIALVDAAGRVVQFLSYEGRFTAVDGPALDVASDDIGVDQPSDTPVGSSLQLVGSGHGQADFVWESGAASPGFLNEGQSITP